MNKCLISCYILVALAGINSSAAKNLSDIIFKDDTVRSYELVYYTDKWLEEMAANKATEAYMPVRFIYRSGKDSIVLDSIGVRYKGNSSYTLAGANPKKSIKLSFDNYRKQTFYGCRTINLNNCIEDPSYMREKIGYDIIGHYIPAPRVSYAVLSINGKQIGVYDQVEQEDEAFLARHFTDSNGTLFKAADGGAALNYIDENKASYEKLYEIKTNKNKDDAWGRLVAMLFRLNGGMGANIVAQTKSRLDFTNCIQHIAWTMVLSHFDSYTGSSRNYYLYDDPTTGRFYMLPWDVNMAFGQFTLNKGTPVNNPAFKPENMATRPLTKVIIENDSLRSIMVYWMREMMNGPAHADTIAKEVDRLKAIIEPYIKVEPDGSRFYPYAQFIESLEKDITVDDPVIGEKTIVGIKSFAKARNTELNKQISAGITFNPVKSLHRSVTSFTSSYLPAAALISIDYTVATGNNVSLVLSNCNGMRIKESNRQHNGRVTWNTNGLAAGVYFISLTSGSGTYSETVTITR